MKFRHLCFNITSLSTFVLVGSALAAPAPIVTSTLNPSNSGEFSFGIGATASVAQRPFIGVNDQSTTLPYFSLNLGDFKIEGLDASYDLINNPKLRVNFLASPRFYERRDSFADNGELSGIKSTSATYFLGVSSQFRKASNALTLQLLKDPQESNGVEALVQYAFALALGENFRLIPSVGLAWQDAQLVDHFYGVSTSEASTGRASYKGNPSLNFNVTVNALWSLTSQLSLLGQLKYEKLGDGITDSSIVDEDSVAFLTIGSVYRF